MSMLQVTPVILSLRIVGDYVTQIMDSRLGLRTIRLKHPSKNEPQAEGFVNYLPRYYRNRLVTAGSGRELVATRLKNLLLFH